MAVLVVRTCDRNANQGVLPYPERKVGYLPGAIHRTSPSCGVTWVVYRLWGPITDL